MLILKNKVFKNASWIIGCKIIQAVLALVISMLTARYLGPSNFGLISYASSLVAFVVPIMELGLGDVLVQKIVNEPNNEGEILGTCLVMNIVSAFACIFGITTFSMIINVGEKDTIIVCFLYSLTLLAQATEMMRYWFQAKLISKYTSIISLIAYTIISVYKIFLLVTQKSVYWFAVSNAIDYFMIGISLIVIYRLKKNQKLSFSFKTTKAMLKKSKYYIISNMMVTIFAQVGKIMLKLFINDAETGYYSAAITCAASTAFIYTAIIESMRPVILESRNKDKKTFEKNVSMLYSIIIYSTLSQCVVFASFAKIVVNILYGSDYAPTINILRLIVWYLPFSYIGSVRNIWILAEEKQKYLWIINLSGALVNIILNVLLISTRGAIGAALATVSTQIFTNVILCFIIKPIKYNIKLLVKGLNPLLIISLFKKGDK